MAKPDPKLNPDQTKVLAFLSCGSEDFGCYGFRPIMKYTGLSRRDVRLACRSMRRKGLTEYHRGCWRDDGEPAGSGYGITEAGRKLADTKLAEGYARRMWH